MKYDRAKVAAAGRQIVCRQPSTAVCGRGDQAAEPVVLWLNGRPKQGASGKSGKAATAGTAESGAEPCNPASG